MSTFSQSQVYKKKKVLSSPHQIKYSKIANAFLLDCQVKGNNSLNGKWTYWSSLTTTVDPVYSERGYSEHPLIVNGFLRTDR